MASLTIDLSLAEIYDLAKTILLKPGANEENAEAIANSVTEISAIVFRCENC